MSTIEGKQVCQSTVKNSKLADYYMHGCMHACMYVCMRECPISFRGICEPFDTKAILGTGTHHIGNY